MIRSWRMFQIWVFTEVGKSVNNSIGSIDFRLFDPWATTAPLILSRMLEDTATETPVFYRVKEKPSLKAQYSEIF